MPNNDPDGVRKRVFFVESWFSARPRVIVLAGGASVTFARYLALWLAYHVMHVFPIAYDRGGYIDQLHVLAVQASVLVSLLFVFIDLFTTALKNQGSEPRDLWLHEAWHWARPGFVDLTRDMIIFLVAWILAYALGPLVKHLMIEQSVGEFFTSYWLYAAWLDYLLLTLLLLKDTIWAYWRAKRGG